MKTTSRTLRTLAAVLCSGVIVMPGIAEADQRKDEMNSSKQIAQQQCTPTPEAVTVPSFSITGIGATIDPGAGNDEAVDKIGKLWNDFYKDAIDKIPNKVVPNEVLGIYSHYESDYRGKYQLTAACEVNASKDIPAKMIHQVVPEQKYLCFKATGEQPASIMKAWSDIWKYFSDPSHPKRAYTVDFEHYKSPILVEIFIAVK